MFLSARDPWTEDGHGKYRLSPVFHLALSSMAQRHVAFCERHVALHERHVALNEHHVALQTVKCLFELSLRHIQPTEVIMTVCVGNTQLGARCA